MATRLIATGNSRPSLMPCIICGQMIEGAGAEYMRVQVCKEGMPGRGDGAVLFETREPIRRHFLNDTHATTLLTIDHKPTEFVKGF